MENDVFVSYRGFDCDFENSLQKIVGNSHASGCGFNTRELIWEFDSGKEASKFLKKVESALKKVNPPKNCYAYIDGY